MSERAEGDGCDGATVKVHNGSTGGGEKRESTQCEPADSGKKAKLDGATAADNRSEKDVQQQEHEQHEPTAAAVDTDLDTGVVTLGELVDAGEQQAQLASEAQAVLGAEEEAICSYDQGYRARQALYSCRTCAPSAGAPVGVCYACATHCHDGHELVELYTKRMFRCDCGNARCTRAGGAQCKLCPVKCASNEENRYNQNYAGAYCTCGRPYPDPDGDDADDCMVQCNICEDWFHTRHVSADGKPTPADDYEEMTCPQCLRQHAFLTVYARRLCSADAAAVDKAAASPPVSPVSESDHCALGDEVTAGGEITSAVYWPAGWRDKLCVCTKCTSLYAGSGVSYLLCADDPVAAHEAKAAARAAADGDPFERFMDKQPATVRNVMIRGYADLRASLTGFLREMAASGRVVTPHDVAAFHERLRAKIPKLVGGTPQHNCK